MVLAQRRAHAPRAARNIAIRTLLDTFFVCGIVTILIIRLQLWATNYPKLGGGKLHIAHLLWGGLAMVTAIVVMLSFLGRAPRRVAAVIGGIGFGFFIDEIGKFVTSDNDYFFKPSAGMIYIAFILLFLVIRELGWHHRWTPQECLTNAMLILSEGSYRQLHEHECRLARELLLRCERTEPLVAPLSTMLEQIQPLPAGRPGPLMRAGSRVRALYYQVAEDPWFATILVGVLVTIAVSTLVEVALDAHTIYAGRQPLHVISAAGMASSVLASGLILVGAATLRASRLAAYRWFDRALLVQIFFTQVFAFLEHQFAAVFGMLLYVALLLVLRTMMHAELHLSLLGQDPLERRERAVLGVSAPAATPPA